MDDFSVIKTAFSGYRRLAAKPMTAVWWLLLAVVLVALQAYFTSTMAGPQLSALRDMRTAGQVDPASMMAVSAGLLQFQLLMLLFVWLAGVVTVGAASRAVLRPDDSALGYLRFGGDELRLLITTLVIGIIVVGLVVVSYIIGMIVMLTAGGREMLQGMRDTGSFPAKGVMLMVIGAAPGALLTIFIAVKLSLASAQTVGEKSIQIFGSWGLTNGRFWKTLAVYAVALIPVIIVGCIGMGIMMIGGQGGLMERMNAMSYGMDTLAHAFDGQHIAAYLVQAVGRVLGMAALLMPAAVIYQAVAPDEVSAFDDDDDDDDDED